MSLYDSKTDVMQDKNALKIKLRKARKQRSVC